MEKSAEAISCIRKSGCRGLGGTIVGGVEARCFAVPRKQDMQAGRGGRRVAEMS